MKKNSVGWRGADGSLCIARHPFTILKPTSRVWATPLSFNAGLKRIREASVMRCDGSSGDHPSAIFDTSARFLPLEVGSDNIFDQKPVLFCLESTRRADSFSEFVRNL